MPDAYLALETGEVLSARSRSPGAAHGELVFTTSYTGYEESLTDPSYETQVLTFAYPLVGNYGVRAERFESDRVHPSAVLARELTDEVALWLREQGVPAVDSIDTRDLVVDIRQEGSMRCGISAGPEASPSEAVAQLETCPTTSDIGDIGERVGVEAVEYHPTGGGSAGHRDATGSREDTGPKDATGVREARGAAGFGVPTTALIDCGTKASIVDALTGRGSEVFIFPHDASPVDIEAVDPDLVFISNGPGDPATYEATEALVESVAGDRPIAGICLGMQIVARAMGGETASMRFGHRGVNQPVLDERTGQVVMTTQNHGYQVVDPGELSVTQVNVNDDTPEALESESLDIITRQYHPEAHPGPHDTVGFFDAVLATAEPPRRVEPEPAE